MVESQQVRRYMRVLEEIINDELKKANENIKTRFLEYISFDVLDDELKSKPDIPIDDIGLSARVLNILKRYGITTIKELCVLSPQEVKKLHNLGNGLYNELIEKLTSNGFYLCGK